MNARLELARHPCFNEDAKHHFGRLHLPVAPKCNIKCNYCDRKYDCANESRPGVASAMLSPGQALRYVERVMEKEADISVVGIAGPGTAGQSRRNPGSSASYSGAISRACSCVSPPTVWPCRTIWMTWRRSGCPCDRHGQCRRPGDRQPDLRLGP